MIWRRLRGPLTACVIVGGVLYALAFPAGVIIANIGFFGYLFHAAYELLKDL